MTLLENGKAHPSFSTPRLVPASLHHTPFHKLNVLHQLSGALWEEFRPLLLTRPGWRQAPKMASLWLKCSGVQWSFRKSTRNAWLQQGPQSRLSLCPKLKKLWRPGTFIPSVHSSACSSPSPLDLGNGFYFLTSSLSFGHDTWWKPTFRSGTPSPPHPLGPC